MDDLFEKLINDKLSPQELIELRKRFNAASDEQLENLIRNLDLENTNSVQVTQEMIDRTKEGIDGQLFGENFHRKGWSWKRILWIAASVILPICIIGAAWIYFDSRQQAPQGICRVTTANGETSSLTLSDGTSVKINGNSSFSFPSGFKKDCREVSFDGEAYFEVASNPEAPFIITTPSMTVSVKGTDFNIMSRPEAKYSELTLDNGNVTVEVNNSTKTVDMKPGTKIILDNESGDITVKPIDYHQGSSSWTTMELHFENATPEFLIDRIEQNYNTTLKPEIKKSIDENFTGTLPADDLDNALRILSRIYTTR